MVQIISACHKSYLALEMFNAAWGRTMNIHTSVIINRIMMLLLMMVMMMIRRVWICVNALLLLSV